MADYDGLHLESSWMDLMSTIVICKSAKYLLRSAVHINIALCPIEDIIV